MKNQPSFKQKILYDTTLLASGYEVASTADYVKNVEKLLRQNLGVDLTAEAKVSVKPAPDIKTEADIAEETKEAEKVKTDTEEDGDFDPEAMMGGGADGHDDAPAKEEEQDEASKEHDEL